MSASPAMYGVHAAKDTAAVGFPSIGSETSVSRLFAMRARASSRSIALICGGETLTYSALNDRANQLARHLLSHGVGPEVIVAVCLPRSLDLVVALLAVVKTGGAYLALDVQNPRARSEWMLRDSGAQLLITNESEWTSQSSPVPVLSLHTCRDAIAKEDVSDLPLAMDTASLFKVVYTSGSTGTPKGVLVPMQAVLHRFAGMSRRFPLVPGDVALLHRSCMIAGSSWDALGPLIAGVPTVVLPRFDPTDAVTWKSVVEQRVSHLAASPSLWQVVMTTAERSPFKWNSLRMAIVGGELTDSTLVGRWARVFPQATLVNVYGLSECIYPAACDAVRTPLQSGHVPAGTPFPNASLHVLSEDWQPAPCDAAGEIGIGGACLARGYLNAPRLTAERFVPNPFSRIGGERIFRTGDWGAWRGDGVLDVAGRRDSQVKVRGTRVDLAEVESALADGDGVRQAAVIARSDRSGETQLVAYVVPTASQPAPLAALRASLHQRLPADAVPAHFVVLREMPMTLQGKIDRVQLAQRAPLPCAPDREGNPPRTATEKAIAAMWIELLDLPQVDRHDDFYAVGGASLSAMQVASRIREKFNVALTFDVVLEAASLAELATTVEHLQAPAGN